MVVVTFHHNDTEVGKIAGAGHPMPGMEMLTGAYFVLNAA